MSHQFNFGKWVDRHLLEIDSKRAELAQKAGKPAPTMAAWRKGADPKLTNVYEIVIALSDMMDMEPSELWENLYLAMGEG